LNIQSKAAIEGVLRSKFSKFQSPQDSNVRNIEEKIHYSMGMASNEASP